MTSTSTEDTYDLIALGSGTGGIAAARRCRREGWRVAVADPLPFGGTCALRGCDPKKMLVGATEALDWTRRMGGSGVLASDLRLSWPDMMRFKRTFTDEMPARVEDGLVTAGIEVIRAPGRFVEGGALKLGERTVRARHYVIATGARPRPLGFDGADCVRTSTEFLELSELPERVVFIGGGFISLEFAHIIARAGSKATVIHRGDRTLQSFDPDLVAILEGKTRELGVELRLDATVERVSRDGDAFRVVARHGGAEFEIVADLVVHGAGRIANVDALGLDTAGVESGPRGVAVNEFMQSTSNPAVYAVGDCADSAGLPLTPVAAFEGRVAAKNMLTGNTQPIEHPLMPSVAFTVPPLARVGMLESEALAAGLEVDVKHRSTGSWYSSMRVAEPTSAFKTIVERGTGRIVGAHLLGPGAEEQVNVLTAAMQAKLTARDVKTSIFAYPSFSSDLGSML